MLYEAESGDFLMALTGESLITRGLSMFREPQFLKLRELLHGADLGFTNAEMLFHNYEAAPTTRPGGTYMRCDPRMLDELKWIGITMVGCANNHSWDFGENGVVVNLQNLERHNLPHAGSGRNLAEASAPTYVDTARGRVALIAATSSGPPGLRAGEQRRDVPGRPGANMLRWTTEYVVDRETLEQLKGLAKNMGWDRERARRLASGMAAGFGGFLGVTEDNDGSVVHLLDQPQYGEELSAKYVLGDRFGKRTFLNKEDLDRNLQWVSDARRMADWVIVTVHNHEGGATIDEPSDHIKTFAHAVIDAGADVFTGHGPHQDRGIEIYNGKPILYSLGDFMLQNDTVALVPHDNMLRYGLGWEATPADFYDTRSGNGTRGQTVEPIRWQSTLAMLNYRGHELQDMELYPVDLGFGRPRSQRGRPLLAEGDTACEILERIRGFSRPFGTTVDLSGETGRIKVA